MNKIKKVNSIQKTGILKNKQALIFLIAGFLYIFLNISFLFLVRYMKPSYFRMLDLVLLIFCVLFFSSPQVLDEMSKMKKTIHLTLSAALAISYLFYYPFVFFILRFLPFEFWTAMGFIFIISTFFFSAAKLSIILSVVFLIQKRNKDNFISLFLSFLPFIFSYSMAYTYENIIKIIQHWC